jgi:imidazole glycerol-phosphate synthase subunit HisH
MTVLIVDYGMGNLASARRAFEDCGADVSVSDDPASIRTAERLVIPGVGAFAEAMERLQHRGWAAGIQEAVSEGVPVLGICLGMQLLAERGDEGGSSEGLGLIKGSVERMTPSRPDERVPHVGWNEVYPRLGAGLFEGIQPGSDFYFVHSFRFVTTDLSAVLATTPYCGETVAAIGRGRIFGVQFHPEKSSRAGFRLIRNFLAE